MIVDQVIANTRLRLLRDIMIIPVDMHSNINKSQVPSIYWDTLRDDMGNQEIGWSFLKDPRNRFSVDGQQWLFRQLLSKPSVRPQFVTDIREPIL